MGQQRRHTGRAATAATAAAMGLMALTTGCVGDGAAASDDPAARDPAGKVRAAADSLLRAGSSRVRTSMEMASGGTRVTVTGEGTYDFRRRLGRLDVVLPQDPAGSSARRRPPVTELMAGGDLYMKNRGAGVPADKWVHIETASLSDGNLVTGGATDPQVAAELLRGAGQVTYVERTRLNGVDVVRYRGVVDLARAARSASKEHGPALRSAAAKGFSKAGVPFDAYVDEQGRLRKLRHRFKVSNGTVASTTWLSGFGAPVDVTLPKGKDIFAGKIAER
ncbi:hypothetical protein [Streptomyces aureoverticillatus]|uniref:hypothetical protein n=1 Tax=Streptomyces aureoverticillatus TaxID=66871 RepID=UPI0013D9BD84|nr:hypothetical protein [Streptomyces aureoverticillatus]QIB44958.1 hypothetical protein G3H79_19680 [Streptomyces aureoverticillatus]